MIVNESKEIIDLEEQNLFYLVKLKPLPKHIAIIMDGNGRWAKMRNLPRVEGHKAGINAVKQVVEGCAQLQIEYLTLFAFSTENWKRPKSEVDTLMKLLKEYLDKELHTLIEKNIKFTAIGRIYELKKDIFNRLKNAMEETSHCTGLNFIIALNYSGRIEIVDAVKKMMSDLIFKPIDLNKISENYIRNYLYTASIPDPDLLIRTSGEYRISNFMLWQIAYSEIWFTDIYWPDFTKKYLYKAILDYQRRERRYGGISE